MSTEDILIECPLNVEVEEEADGINDVVRLEENQLSTAQLLCRITSLIAIGAFIYLTFWNNSQFWAVVFVYHPLFMVVAFMGALPELMCTVAGFHSRKFPFSRVIRTHLKWTMVFKALSLLGIVAVEWTKFVKSKNHFKSWHGIIGAVCEASQFLEALVGLSMYFNAGGRFFSSPQARLLRVAHRLLAVVVILTGLTSMSLGMFTKFAVEVYGALAVRVAFAILPIVLALWGYACPFVAW
ncbi:ferric reductase transmembrane protein [Trypanosoma brucei equiperdum]|uniref:Ferric reductase transmembrane protein n=1 Tax=Trypanosoma brucei equiperdum TaxID=630700 RepID=A0A3L6L5F2_9TRYP|nr:ferric reductase transmembrane protein [Trypanosoma brucei equiperdum]